MDLVYPIIISIVFILYLVFFFKAIYPQKERSRVSRFLPFGLIVACTGVFYGAIFYIELILHRTLNLNFYICFSYVFLIAMVILLHLTPIPFRGRVILYALAWGFGGVAYLILMVYFKASLEGAGSEALWTLVVGLFAPPLSAVGSWGIVQEDREYAHFSPTLRFWSNIGLDLLIYALFSFIFGGALSYAPLIVVGILECVGGFALVVSMEWRMRHPRRDKDDKDAWLWEDA